MGLKIKPASLWTFLTGADSQHQQASELGDNPVLWGWEPPGPKINKSAGESDQR